MLPDQRQLVAVRGIADDHALDTARVGHPENMQRLGEIERHHAVRHLVYVLLRGLCSRPDGRYNDEQGDGGCRPAQWAPTLCRHAVCSSHALASSIASSYDNARPADSSATKAG